MLIFKRIRFIFKKIFMMDDDGDMAEMYLTDKLEQQLDNSSSSFVNEEDDLNEEILQTEIDDRFWL